MPEIRSGLTGSVWVVVRDGVSTSHYVNQFLKTVIRISLPSLGVGKRVALGCTVGEFEIEDGLV